MKKEPLFSIIAIFAFLFIFIGLGLFLIGRGDRITENFNIRCKEIGGIVASHRVCVNDEHIVLYIPWDEYAR